MIEKFSVNEEEVGLRLDKILKSHFPNQSRTYFQRLIKQGKVSSNGAPIKKHEKLNLGDQIQIEFKIEKEPSFITPEDLPLDILYEDEALLVINKPAGLVVHPGAGNWTGTLANALMHYCQRIETGTDPLRPGIVHRLDKETSGVIVVAKTLIVHQHLTEQFANRTTKKEYRAICIGNPGDQTIEGAIARHPINRKKMCIDDTRGKAAITECRLLTKGPKLSYIQLFPHTGRTHQIRVHLTHVGSPILGDHVYGTPSWNQKMHVTRQLLHAFRLSFQHPFTGKDVTFEASIPEDMQKNIEKVENVS